MPFGLINALVIFQAYINKALSRIIDYFIVIYLNNILIYFKPGEDHYTYIRIVIKRLRKYKLYTKLSKYFFNIKEIKFLGFIIGSIGVKPDPDKILTIKKWPKPELFYKVQVFLRFANFYQRFIY
jgi:hypothetical protein